MFGHQRQIATVGGVQTQVIHPQTRQGAVGDLAGQAAVALDQGEVDHPAQQATGDAGRAPGAAGDLSRAFGVRRDAQQPGAPGHDQVQFLDRVELQPGRNAEPIAQRRRQKAQPGRRADQGKGLQLDPHGARGRAFADHQVQFEVLERRIEDLLDRRVHAVDLVDEQHVARLEIGQDRREVPGPGQNRA